MGIPEGKWPGSIGDLVVQWPRRGIVFDSFGIDFAFGGSQSLEQACAKAGADLEMVQRSLLTCDATVAGEPPTLPAMDLGTLARHIVQVHHSYLWRLFPELQERVDRAGGNKAGFRESWMRFRSAMEDHMVKEEKVVFPLLCQLETGDSSSRAELSRAIAMMESEHCDHEHHLSAIRLEMGRFGHRDMVDEDSRVLFEGLKEMEFDIRQHIHKENNILFPSASARVQAECGS